MKKLRYSIEFKNESVEKVLVSGMSVANAAADVGIAFSTMSKWLREYKERQNDPNALSETDMEKLKRLEKEVHELRLERDLLKKTALYFAKDSK